MYLLLKNKKQSQQMLLYTKPYCPSNLQEQKPPKNEWCSNEITKYPSLFVFPLLLFYLLFSLAFLASQQVQDDDLLITGFICLSSSREIIPKCDGSSSIIFATRYPAIDHVWYFLACLPIYLPSFPS